MLTHQTELESLLAAAVEIADEAERAAYIERVCAGNPQRRDELQAMVRDYFAAGSLLDCPPAFAATIASSTERVGTLIGPYKLRELLGEGGMGSVFVAEQEQPIRRKVALKIIKPGMDSRQVIARFEAEKQALAMMDHPNIAKIFDAGVTGEGTRDSGLGAREEIQTASPLCPLPSSIAPTARPYFVMELVRGVPITEFCDQRKLTTRQRLELFVEVCRAIQHAHQRGIIHRDIKPSNVLVTLHDDKAVPKVIDFGIAKATSGTLARSASEGHSIYTGFAQLLGTPLYMSPEQAEMNALDVDTRSDVYSLGVLLYELLTGTTPFDKDRLKSAGFDEMRRIIREEEPETVSARLARTSRGVGVSPTVSSRQTPSAASSSSLSPSPSPLAPRLSELDWIVMKALEKDRTRRYESASSLAADIQRYLSDEPVLACPPTTMYRFQKFARKHKPALVTAGAIVACLLLGTSVSAWQAVRATTAETQANANATEAQEKAQEAKQQRNEAQQQRDEAQRQRDEVKALADKLFAKEQQLQKALYAAHINLAQRAWEAGATDQVEEYLAKHQPKAGESDLRTFEWHYLNRLCNSSLLTLRGHKDYVYEVTYSPDGKRLASASQDGTVKLWDAQSGKELFAFKGHFRPVTSARFSPDGKYVASCTGDSRGPFVTDVENSTPAPGLVVWEAETGKVIHYMKKAYTPALFSPDGTRLAAVWHGDDEGYVVKVWDANTGKQLLSWMAHNHMIEDLVFSSDGKWMATAAGDRTAKIWNAQTGEEVAAMKSAGDSVKFFPDNKRLLSGGGERVAKVWDAQTGRLLSTVNGVRSFLSLRPDGKQLAAGNGDRTVHILDLQTGNEIRTIKGAGRHAAYSPDGRYLATCAVEGSSDYTVNVWDTQTDQENRTVQHTTGYNVAISPDGRLMATGERNLPGGDQTNARLWNLKTGETILTLKGHKAAVHGVAFSLDGKRLATGGTGRATGGGTTTSAEDIQEVIIWDVQTGKELQSISGQRFGAFSLAFSPDGKRLASRRKVWDVETGQEILSLDRPATGPGFRGGGGWGQCVAYSSDGKYLAVGGGIPNVVTLINAQTGEEIRSFSGGGQGVAFSSDGKRLASSVIRPDEKVWVWDVESGRELFTAKGGGSGIAFSADGKRLASGGIVWDAETGAQLLSLDFNGNGTAFSPDGRSLVSVNGSQAKIWDATPLPEKP